MFSLYKLIASHFSIWSCTFRKNHLRKLTATLGRLVTVSTVGLSPTQDTLWPASAGWLVHSGFHAFCSHRDSDFQHTCFFLLKGMSWSVVWFLAFWAQRCACESRAISSWCGLIVFSRWGGGLRELRDEGARWMVRAASVETLGRARESKKAAELCQR